MKRMKAFEFLEENEKVVRIMVRNGLTCSSLAFIDIMKDYITMTQRNYKMSYVYAELSRRYRISPRQLYRIIQLMNEEIDTSLAR